MNPGSLPFRVVPIMFLLLFLKRRLYSFQRPFLLCTQEKDKDDNDRWKQTAKFFMIPVREGRCRIITAVPIFTKKWLPNWISHAFVSR